MSLQGTDIFTSKKESGIEMSDNKKNFSYTGEPPKSVFDGIVDTKEYYIAGLEIEQEENKHLRTRIAELENENLVLEQSLKNQMKDVDALAKTGDRLEAENEKLKSTLELHAGDVCSLNNEIDQMREETKELTAENERNKAAVFKYEPLYISAMQHNEELEAEIERLKKLS